MCRSLLLGALAVVSIFAYAGQTAVASVNGAGSTTVTGDPPLPVDGGWQSFSFGGVGSFNAEGPWTFTDSNPTTLTVTDAFLSGDQFQVFDFGVSLGLTSLPTQGHDLGSNPDGSLADSYFSHGVFSLAGGSHSITIQDVLSPYGAGGAYLEAATARTVPVPAAAATGMELLGVISLGWAFRKYRSQSLQKA